MGAVGQQERPKAAPGRVGRRDGAALEQAGEVPLRQVEGPLGAVPLAADEGVEREPVGVAQLGQRLARFGAAPSPAATTRLQRVVGKPPGGIDSFLFAMTVDQEHSPGEPRVRNPAHFTACSVVIPGLKVDVFVGL